MKCPTTAALWLLACAAATAAPAAGRYDASLCVTLGEQSPSCGPAQARLRSGGRLQVQVSDIEYRLRLRSSQAEVLLMHGSMQIDEFTVAYEWAGSTLRFSDPAKPVHYEVRFGPRSAAPK